MEHEWSKFVEILKHFSVSAAVGAMAVSALGSLATGIQSWIRRKESIRITIGKPGGVTAQARTIEVDNKLLTTIRDYLGNAGTATRYDIIERRGKE